MIYLDNNSTTQIDPRVLEEMLPYFIDTYANASSTHKFGMFVNGKVNIARDKISSLIGAEKNEIIFTSGATESINLALKGFVENHSHRGRHIVTLKTEHKAVLDVCNNLETQGIEVTYLSVKSDGLLDLNELIKVLRKDTILVSVMFVNNEIGVVQPIDDISEIVHKNNSVFMTDATQAVGKIPIDVDKLGIDLMTFSAHKFYGPKGIGGLFIRSGQPQKFNILPIIHGGGHERGYRSGTINVPGIIGLGKAAEIADNEMKNDARNIKILRDYLESELLKLKNSKLNGNKQKRLFNTSNICFKNVDAETIIASLKNISISNGSACSSQSIVPSHVLKALGLTDEEAFSSLRFSLGKFNTKNQIDIALNEIKNKIFEISRIKTGDFKE